MNGLPSGLESVGNILCGRAEFRHSTIVHRQMWSSVRMDLRKQQILILLNSGVALHLPYEHQGDNFDFGKGDSE